MSLSRGFNAIIAYKFVREITKDWTEMKAYDLGIVDEEGNILKKRKDLDTREEKEAYTFFHRLVWNLKKLLEKTPGGASKIKSYAAALWLLKENAEELETDLLELYGPEEKKKAKNLFEEVVNVTGGIANSEKPIFKKKKKKKKDSRKETEDCEEEEDMEESENKIKRLQDKISSISNVTEKRLKKVVRGGKLKKKVTCGRGKRVKNGKCVSKTSKDKQRFTKAARKRKRKMAGKSTSAADRKRKRSSRKRYSMGI